MPRAHRLDLEIEGTGPVGRADRDALDVGRNTTRPDRRAGDRPRADVIDGVHGPLHPEDRAHGLVPQARSDDDLDETPREAAKVEAG